MNKPLISIIITNYNYGQFIPKAIESVFEQTYPNIELVIINDGSTDDSDEVIREIIDKNPDRNIKYITRENHGVVYTRNEGIEVASGEYICYLDADDYFNKDYIENSYYIAIEFGADVVYPNWHYVGDWLGRPDTNFPEFSNESLQLQKLHCTPASLIRSRAIGDLRFESEKVAEDWDFFIGLSLKGAKFKLAKDNYINYRIRQGTRSSRNDPKVDTQHFVEILKKHKERHGDSIVDPQRLVKLRHPNFIMKILSMRYPRTIRESIDRDGVKKTALKIVRKIVSRNPWLMKLTRSLKNNRYKKSTVMPQMINTPGVRLAVIVHLYYPELWPDIQKRLEDIDEPFDIFVSVQLKDKEISLSNAGKQHKATNIIAFPNRGRDVLPFLLIAEQLRESGQYDYLLKLHSKKSPHRGDGQTWFSGLLDQLIPSDTSGIIRALQAPDTGAIGPGDHVVSLSRYMGDNRRQVKILTDQISRDDGSSEEIFDTLDKYPFFGGTMFWCRLDLLHPLLDIDLTPADFNKEGGQVDATTAHAIERILGGIIHMVAGKKMYTVKDSAVKVLPNRSFNEKYNHGPSDG
ncbi:hypothetical protein B7Z28_00150 [Candidatus Saccharibacteria bacterium 32-45-3]|nr:MAG: hypothetical protein B7Z28_00150 [Candidatus Saccharibacteria bacterium 32-45-3]